jgi:hypothetical protein
MRRPALLRLSCAAAALTFALAPRVASAEGTSLRANLVEAKSIKLDGVPKEWSALSALGFAVKGRPTKADLEAHAGIAYDASNVYIAADVTDDVLRAGGDHLQIVLGFPGGNVDEVDLYPGDPGKTPGSAKTKDGAAITARVVEAPRSGGWSLEASIPWSAFPQAKLVRVGLRGAIFVHDADSSATVKSIVGTAPSPAYASLPSINTESEQSLFDGLIHEKSLRGAPRYNLLADVAGDAMKERVLVFDRWLVVLGSSFRKGSEYYYGDLGVAGDQIPSCEVRDLTGDGQSEIILRKRFVSGSRTREMVQVMSFGAGEVPLPIFQHELSVSTDQGSVADDLTFTTDGGKTAIKITPGKVTGFNAGNYREPTETTYDPVLLPWGAVASRTYKFNGKEFSKSAEEKQSASAAPASAAAMDAALPKAPPPPSAGELLDKVYDLYKRDRGVSGRPRFDFAADLAGDKQVERVLLHDRDLVIFGKGYKGGTGYTFLTLSPFAAASDILDVSARDVTGDGKVEILVKGVIHAGAPRDAGGGTVDREVVMIYQMASDGLKRIFSAEIARSIGRKRVSGTIGFGGKGDEIELAPGKAVDWTEKTYPFNQDPSAVGGIEPLILPWSGARAVRYRWAGGAFSR